MGLSMKEAKAQLAKVIDAGGWLGDDEYRLLEEQRKREEQAAAYQRAEKDRVLAQQRQYAESNQALIDGIVNAAPGVKKLAAELRRADAAIDQLHNQMNEVAAKVMTLESAQGDDLGQAAAADLVDVALRRHQAESVELRALHDVQEELRRRIVKAEADRGDLRAAFLREQRRGLHVHVDGLIKNAREPLGKMAAVLEEIRQVEDAIRGLGGVRQAFFSRGVDERIQHIAERWEQELAEIERFSEAH